MKLERILSKRDAILLLELINKVLACASDEELREAVLGLKALIPFEHAACSLARVGPDGVVQAAKIINVNYPAEWIVLYAGNRYHEIDPIYIENFRRFRMQYWSDTYGKYAPPKAFLHQASDFGLRKGYTNGLRNIRGDIGSLVSVSGDAIERGDRTETILEIFIPHVHQALLRLDRERRLGEKAALHRVTDREREILNWIKQGKNTWDISALLGISERTVKYHIKGLTRKLDAVSRAQAVAIALQMGIIDLD